MEKILKIMIVFFIYTTVNGQSISPVVLASSGGEGNVGDNSVSWTLGEMSIMTLEDGNIITQGFHQPNLIITKTSQESDLELVVYPNPTQDVLLINNDGRQDLDFLLIDNFGKMVMEGQLNIGLTELKVNGIPSGHYFLRVLNGDNLITSYKIEKTGL
ncbi:MAG: T9SS type A sorting domain-containing protein [Saprospiraceae bacterium]|nr:T9SS type A sorting domain-containing protein [Saprospiraceae bacterium]